MEQLIAFIQTALGLRAKQGWFFLIVGLSMLALVHFNVLPKAELAAGWIAFFYLFAVVGCTILIVSAGAQIYGAVDRSSAGRSAKREADRKLLMDEAEGLATAKVLTGSEAAALVVLLHRNDQIIATPNASAYSLIQKKILVGINPRGSVYKVSDLVWANREELREMLRHHARVIR